MNKPRNTTATKSALQHALLYTDLSDVQKSTFTLTFVVEIVGIDVWHDCNEGWLDLGPCSQGMKLTYQLYYGQLYEVDILIWPHVAKIWHGEKNGWVRSWQFLEHRFIAFSIRHTLPVRVEDLQYFEATVLPTYGLASLGSNARNDKNTEVYLPKLEFGQRRYFAPVVETLEEPLHTYFRCLIWNAVEEILPTTFLDGVFDTPLPVTDVRLQDAVVEHVQNLLLNRSVEYMQKQSSQEQNAAASKGKVIRDSKSCKFEISLSGAAILAGTGRVMPFKKSGDRLSGTGEIIVLISSTNLPAQDDLPVLFVNVEKLFNVPLKELRTNRITQLYTRWILNDEKHDSETEDLKSLNLDMEHIIDFHDHYAVPLDLGVAAKIAATFLDTAFEIQLRGQRLPAPPFENPKYFGYEKVDRDFGKAVPPRPEFEDLDPLIAVTKIDARQLAKCLQTFIRGEYPLFPPPTSIANNLNREAVCTNDINAISAQVVPKLVIPSYVILQAQMTLEASMGIVGCRARRLQLSFSRMFALISDSDSAMTLLRYVMEINEELSSEKEQNLLLSGFAVDAGDKVIFFLEGLRDGNILKVWGRTEDLYPKVKPVFSSSSRYVSRIYPELLVSDTPFCVLKMFAPLSLILACPPVYSRPALPLPTRSVSLSSGFENGDDERWKRAYQDFPMQWGTGYLIFMAEHINAVNIDVWRQDLDKMVVVSLAGLENNNAVKDGSRIFYKCVLKLGRLVASKFHTTPCRADMPSLEELRSFRLELCSPPHPPFIFRSNIPKENFKDPGKKQVKIAQPRSLASIYKKAHAPNQTTANWEKPAKTKKHT